ncbi:MAG: hypothetical protein AB7O48_06290 [Cyclobacteriaceae bacterium]
MISPTFSIPFIPYHLPHFKESKYTKDQYNAVHYIKYFGRNTSSTIIWNGEVTFRMVKLKEYESNYGHGLNSIDIPF